MQAGKRRGSGLVLSGFKSQLLLSPNFVTQQKLITYLVAVLPPWCRSNKSLSHKAVVRFN